jgi:drug/metabolite transporter (DMT)-like permease
VNALVKAHLSLFTVNVLYGASHVVAKGVMPHYLTPNVFILFRVLGATLLFWLIKLFLPRERISRKDIPLLILCGLFGISVNQLFFFHGLSLSSSINSGIIMTINPILVVVIAYFLLKEPVTRTKLTGIILGTTGAVLLTLLSSQPGSSASLGDVFLFINALSYAIYLVIAKPLMNRYSPLTVITYVFTFGSVFVIAFPPTIPELMQTLFSGFPTDIIVKIVFVVVGVTFLTYLLTMVGLKYLSPAVSSGYIYLQPVLVILFAYLFAAMGIAPDYTDAVTLEKTGCMLLIFAGVFLLSRTVKKPTEPIQGK